MSRFCFFILFPLLSLFGLQGKSSYPYLSGYSWAFFADWRLLGEDYGNHKSEDFVPEKVGLGDTVFVDLSRLDAFVKNYLPRIGPKFILITSNYGYDGDSPAPGRFEDLAYHPKISAWYLQNLDREAVGNLIPIPIGIASSHFPHGNTKTFDQVILIAERVKIRKDIPIYINVTQRPERADCIAHFQRMGCRFFAPTKPLRDYLFDLARSKFVISPRGNGLDTHRLWETLLLGSYPVVQTSTLDPLYERLPVVVVDKWEDVTPEFLEQKYLEFSAKEWNLEKLYAPYWFNQVKKMQKKIRREDESSRKKIAICYSGLTRSTKKVYQSHFDKVFHPLEEGGIDYDVFIHTWRTKAKQRIWETEINKPIDYQEYLLLNPDYYQLDDQDVFTDALDFSQYFYQDVADKKGYGTDGEWNPGLILNHLCALESLKRVTNMVAQSGNQYDFIMYIRPDVQVNTKFPVSCLKKMEARDILISNHDHFEGYNDRFAALRYETAPFYGNRIDGLIEYRKTQGRIVSEKYVKYVCDKNKLSPKFIAFDFKIVRP